MTSSVGSNGSSSSDSAMSARNSWWQCLRARGDRLARRWRRLRYRMPDRATLIERLNDSQSDGLIDIDALTMLEGVLHVSDMQVRDIIVPRAQMDVIARDAGLDEIIDDVVESAHSRFPVIGDSRDDVVGILLAKDVLRFVGANAPESFDIQEILRPAVFVPEAKRLNVLLKEFRLNRNHMAIVVDEYGGVAGLVTIEDVLEQIVGEIEDEHDVEDYLTQIMRHPSGRFTVKALTPLEEFNAFFDVDYSLDEFDTVGGLVLNRFGHMPKRGDQLSFDSFDVRVLRADARRVHLLELRVRPRDVENDSGGHSVSGALEAVGSDESRSAAIDFSETDVESWRETEHDADHDAWMGALPATRARAPSESVPDDAEHEVPMDEFDPRSRRQGISNAADSR